MIEFNGTRGSALGVFVERYPPRPIPKRKQQVYSVPGRSGDVVVTEAAFENVRQRYDVYLSAECAGLPLVAAAAVAWLHAPGYCRLEDMYDRDSFRLARFIGPEELENIFNQFGRGTIEFDCLPQRFLKSGDQFRSVSNGETLFNPTPFAALPLIELEGEGDAALTLGGSTLALSLSGAMTLDCAEREAYRETADGVFNLNSAVSGTFPLLAPGESQISWAGEISSVRLKPRWFVL